MMRQAVGDTGAIVALLDRSDQHHEWALECFKTIKSPLITCEAVLTEAWYLLGWAPPSRAVLASLCRDGVIQIDFSFERQMESVLSALEKYEDIPMDFADACVVRLAELFPQREVWTTNSHFKFYRRSNRTVIRVLAPWK